MGYPMTYKRVVERNRLTGDGYNHPGSAAGETPDSLRSILKGDMRRLEQDQRDEAHLKMYASHAGISTEQARTVLDLFFEGNTVP